MTDTDAPPIVAYGYRELIVWQKAVDLAVVIFRFTSSLPAAERIGLALQLNRAAVSVASNIAEGSKRSTPRDFQHFLAIAHGSLAELDTQLEIAMRVGYITRENASDALELMNAIARILTRMRQRLRHRRDPPLRRGT